MRILFVDDERAFRQSTAELLTAWGFDVVQFGDPSDAIGYVLESAKMIDIALVDLSLDGDIEAGIELLRILKTNLPAVPSVVLTGHVSLTNATLCAEAGMFSFVSKDEIPEKLQHALMKAVRERFRRIANVAGVSKAHSDSGDVVVLLVDDVEEFRDSMAEILNGWGYGVVVFGDPSEVTGDLLDDPGAIDVALIDMKFMSDKEAGLDLLLSLRAHAPAVPSIVLTGYPRLPNARKAAEAGMFSYVIKDEIREKLQQTLMRAVDERQRRLRAVFGP